MLKIINKLRLLIESLFLWNKTMVKYDVDLMKRMAEADAGDKIVEFGLYNEITDEIEDDVVYEVIVNEHYNDGRFKSEHDLVFLDTSTGKYYHTRYERGLTEYQMYSPFDFLTEVHCNEVTISQETVTYTKTTWAAK